MIDLDQEFSDSADRMAAPPFDVADDIARGRRRQGRRRLAIGAGAAVASGALAAAAVFGPTLFPAANPEKREVGYGTSVPRGDESGPPREARSDLAPPDVAKWRAAAELRQAAADVLDPRGQHARPGPAYRNVQMTGGPGGQVSSLGSRLTWANAGQDGLGMIQVEVSLEAPGTCDDCEQLSTPDGGTAQLDTSIEGRPDLPGAWQVTYQRPDGLTATVLVSNIFGNNSETGTEVDVTPADVARLVVDQRLAVLPLS